MGDINLTREIILNHAQMACDTLMNKFAPEALPPVHQFHYHQGVFLSGMYETYLLCGREAYFEYIKGWVDSLIDQAGNITQFNPGQLDDLQPGILLFPLYARTGDFRYKAALDIIAYYLERFPRTSEGGFWHKAWHREEMWLDGLYMGGPFMAQYGAEFDKPLFFDIDAQQAALMFQKTHDDKTGLWYHAWDSEKRQDWADPVTGRSPEFWGRSMGWVPVALLNELDFFPEDHPGRKTLIDLETGLLRALAKYQDSETGLWYQVVNKGDRPENWLETSCTSLYAAGICKAVRLGLMEESYLSAARRAVGGVLGRLSWDDRGIIIDKVCIGTGVGDYAHYCARPTSANDLHGVGAFLIMCAEAARIL